MARGGTELKEEEQEPYFSLFGNDDMVKTFLSHYGKESSNGIPCHALNLKEIFGVYAKDNVSNVYKSFDAKRTIIKPPSLIPKDNNNSFSSWEEREKNFQRTTKKH